MVDDLVDESDKDPGHGAQYWILQCSRALDVKIGKSENTERIQPSPNPATARKLKALQSSVDCLPLCRLTKQPLYDLLNGFQMDIGFDSEQSQFPIRSEKDLDLYGSRVASTVATLFLDLVHHHNPNFSLGRLETVKKAGVEMGKALQCVNIARDIGRDAAIERVYIPTSWLALVDLTPLQVIQSPDSPKVHQMQQKMLDLADNYYNKSRAAIEELPREIRGPVRTTVESYFEIGRALRTSGEIRCDGMKFRLPLWRRLVVAWLAMQR